MHVSCVPGPVLMDNEGPRHTARPPQKGWSALKKSFQVGVLYYRVSGHNVVGPRGP